MEPFALKSAYECIMVYLIQMGMEASPDNYWVQMKIGPGNKVLELWKNWLVSSKTNGSCILYIAYTNGSRSFQNALGIICSQNMQPGTLSF